jgi:bile acid:Na+ symporter, BASS family
VSIALVGVLLLASMTAVGTALTVADLHALTRRRTVLAVAVAVNVVAVPALAVLACTAAALSPVATFGIVLAAAAPGGGTGALLTLYARGDLALSAALQAVLAPLGLLAIPVWTAVAGHDAVPTGWTGAVVVAGGLIGQLVPLAGGMWLRRYRPATAVRLHRLARRAADVLLAGVVGYFLITAGHQLSAVGWAPLGVAGLLVVTCLAVAAVPRLGRPVERRAMSMTTAVRNLSLALFVAAPAAAGAVLVLLAYGLVMYVLSVPTALWLGRRST